MTRAPEPRAAAGFTYVEVLIAFALLAGAMLALCGICAAGYRNLTGSGRTTIGLAAARQMAEDLRSLSFASVGNLNGFDTDDPGTLPASDPEREIARRWRYVLSGDGVGWGFTSAERTRWTTLSLGEGVVGGAGSVVVVPRSAALSEVRLSVSIPGRWRPVELSTFVASLAP